MRSGGLTSAFGGNLAVMDIYAAQQVFGRGRRFDRIDLKLQERARRRSRTGRDQERPRRRLRRRAAGIARAAARIDAGGLRHLDEHLERLRAVHRHVHHLQLVLHCGHPAAVGNRHPARARRAAPADQKSLPHRKRCERSPGLCRRHCPRHLHGARDGGVHLEHARGHLWRRRARGGSVRRSAAARRRHRDRHQHQHDCGVAARAKRVARRSGSGAAEREISGADRRRESRAPLDRGRR